MTIQSLTLRFTTGTPPTQVTTTQEIPVSTINLSGSNSVPISQSLIDAVNAQPAGTSFTPSIAASYGNDESGNAITRVTSLASNAPSFIPRVISLASVINKTTTDAPFNLSGLITTISTGVLSYSSSNTSVASVNSSGRVTLLTEGITTITINVTATADHIAGSASTTLNVRPPPRWRQLGGDIDGKAANDLSGSSVSLSSDGTILVVGALLNDGNGVDSGHVRVYKRDTNEALGWIQLGGDIDGKAANDFSGSSVSLSSDGTILAVGAYADDGNGFNSGHVRVYKRDTNEALGWKQLGSDIDGEDANDFSGSSVSLSSDGTILAVGALRNDGNGVDSGHVRVYKRDTNEALGWIQLGGDINGEAAGDESGSSVSLSSDGTILAVGASYNFGNGSYSGHVKVYKRDTNEALGWIQLGGDINGEAAYDLSGSSVSLSSDGTILAVGATGNDGNGSNSGHVKVYKRDTNEALGWIQLGGDINGEAGGDSSGSSVSLSSDGTILAVGAYGNDGNGSNSGHVRVYKRDTNEALGWKQLGSDINGEAANDFSGFSVSLSSDGTILAVGARLNSGNGSSSGHARVYKFE
jgi:hypothetical protein